MGADIIDNLENTMTLHRVDYILVTMKAPETNQEVEEGKEEYGRPTKNKMPENPLEGDDFVSLSTGLEATTDIKDNLLKAKEVGLKGCQDSLTQEVHRIQNSTFLIQKKKIKKK